MKANELRIGNYLEGTKLSIPRLGIESDGVYQITGLGIQMIEAGELAYEPILLTEEWLKTLGFESNGSQFWYKGYDYTIDTRGNKFVVHSDYTAPIYGTEVKYIHQLQNLYFALTGEELTAEPTCTTKTI